MKKIVYILSALILIMTGCNEKTDFTLKGEINGLPSDTLVAFFQIPEYDIDTIICKNGTFEYSFSPDTSTVFTLLIDEQNSIPVYAENGKSVEIKGTTTNFTIQGEGENELMNNIIKIRDQFQIAIMLIEHDMNLVMGICEGICVLNYGRIIAKGTADEIQSNPTVIEAYLGKKKEG